MRNILWVDDRVLDPLRFNCLVIGGGLAFLGVVILACLVIALCDQGPPRPMPDIRKSKGVLFGILALCGILAGPAATRADQPDSGLEKRFSLSLGLFDASTFDLLSSSSSSHGLAAKLDYSFFRPTRHEAVATIWYLSGRSGGSSESLFAGTAEYRWRFGGHGIAYWSTGLGPGSGSSFADTVTFDAGSTIKRTFAVVGNEKVYVPVGTFETLEVQETATDDIASKTTYTNWYSPQLAWCAKSDLSMPFFDATVHLGLSLQSPTVALQ